MRLIPLPSTLIALSLIALTAISVRGAGVSAAGASPRVSALFRETQARAEAGDAIAEMDLGFLYEHGKGVAENHAEASKWLRKAAFRGVPAAQFDLALSYYNGRGVSRDYVEGLKWYRAAATDGLALAQYNLALRYGFGLGVPQDNVEAYKWFTLATQNRVHPSREPQDVFDVAPTPTPAYMALVKEKMKEVFHSMTPQQITDGQRVCREFAAHQPVGFSQKALTVSSSPVRAW